MVFDFTPVVELAVSLMTSCTSVLQLPVWWTLCGTSVGVETFHTGLRAMEFHRV